MQTKYQLWVLKPEMFMVEICREFACFERHAFYEANILINGDTQLCSRTDGVNMSIDFQA